MTRKLHGILLDIDGTLIDSNDANARAWMEALRAHGLEINYLKIREAVGMGGDNFLPKVAGLESDSPQGKAISKTRGEILKQKYLPTLRAFPQTKELLTRLHEDGLKLVVATSAKLDEAKPLLRVDRRGSVDRCHRNHRGCRTFQAGPGHSSSRPEEVRPCR